jgi:hypothetical protein
MFRYLLGFPLAPVCMLGMFVGKLSWDLLGWCWGERKKV